MIEIRPPNNWGNLAGIPTDLTDGKITWGEVMDKPATFPATPQAGIEMAEWDVNYIDFHTQGQGAASTDFDARIIAGKATTPGVDSTAFLQYQALYHNFAGPVRMVSIPSSTNGVGLASGSLYRDANNFLKIVP